MKPQEPNLERQQREGRRLEAIFDAVPDPIVVINAAHVIERGNRAAAELFGYSIDALSGMDLSEMLPEMHTGGRSDPSVVTIPLAAWLIGNSSERLRVDAPVPGKRSDGSSLLVRLSTARFKFEEETLFAVTISDVTDRRREEAELIRYIHDLESAKAQTEAQAEQVSDLVEDLAAEKDNLREQKDQLRLNEKELFEYVQDLEMTRSQFEKQAGDMAWLAEQLNAEKEQVEESRRVIEYQANHDPLTQLGNRALLSKVLPEMIEDARNNGTRVGFICIDLDNFKAVNDHLGHESGDLLLCSVADALRSNIRAEDAAIRQGGDEFSIVAPLNETRNEADLREMAERIRLALTISVEGPGRVIETGASIGIALFPDDGQNTDAIRTAGDDALYRAKRAGKGRVV